MFMLENARNIQLKYQIIDRNKSVGYVQSKIGIGQIHSQAVVLKETIVKISTGDVFFGQEESLEVETILIKDQKMIHYEGLADENGKRSEVSIRLIAGMMIMDAVEKDEKILEVLSFDEFDCTSEQVVERFLSSRQESATYRVLDLTRFEIEKVDLQRKKTETVSVANKDWECQVVAIKNLDHPIMNKIWVYELANQFITVKELEKESDDMTLILLESLETNIDTVDENPVVELIATITD